MSVGSWSPYFVSSHGRIKGPNGIETCNTWGRDGYLGFKSLGFIHRRVAKQFVPNPRPDIFDCVDHIDRIRNNNFASNLRWVNRQLNHFNNKNTSPAVFQKLYDFYTGPDKPNPPVFR